MRGKGFDPLAFRRLSNRRAILAVAVCSLLGLFWSTLPLVGWSHYSLEGALTSCSVEWNGRTCKSSCHKLVLLIKPIYHANMIFINYQIDSVISYNMAMALFVFVMSMGFTFQLSCKAGCFPGAGLQCTECRSTAQSVIGVNACRRRPS